MLILAGQGNPGPKYAGNRHNAGFLVLDRIHADHGFGPWRSKFESQISEGTINTGNGRVKVLLVKPETFYNETGRALSKAVTFYKLDIEAVTVFHDEIDLAPGRTRVKRGGGHSGNNGVRSITAHIGENLATRAHRHWPSRPQGSRHGSRAGRFQQSRSGLARTVAGCHV